MSDIYFYVCSCDRKKIDKSNALAVYPSPRVGNTNGGIHTFKVKTPCSIFNPEILIAAESIGKSYADINYAYVPAWGRYYFVDDIIAENDGLLRFTLSVDVLMTYHVNILNSQQFVVRAESLNSALYIDTEKPIQSNKLLSMLKLGTFPESISTTTNNYVLTVSGG